jgi:hypothetical protein
MRILLAIESTKPKVVGDNALRWAGRIGYDVAVFAPRNKHKKYLAVINDVNYHYYLALEYDVVVTKYSPQLYAALNNYDLIVYIPEDLPAWRKGTAFKDNELNPPYSAIGNARGEFGRKPGKKIKRWSNGCRMERVG